MKIVLRLGSGYTKEKTENWTTPEDRIFDKFMYTKECPKPPVSDDGPKVTIPIIRDDGQVTEIDPEHASDVSIALCVASVSFMLRDVDKDANDNVIVAYYEPETIAPLIK